VLILSLQVQEKKSSYASFLENNRSMSVREHKERIFFEVLEKVPGMSSNKNVRREFAKYLLQESLPFFRDLYTAVDGLSKDEGVRHPLDCFFLGNYEKAFEGFEKFTHCDECDESLQGRAQKAMNYTNYLLLGVPYEKSRIVQEELSKRFSRA
jgi:hypothetical protein